MADEGGQEAYRQALKMLGRRALTRGELVRRLEQKGFDAREGRAAADRAAESGYLDDEGVAEMMARRLVLEKSYGARRASREMRKRLLEPELIRAAILALEEEDPDFEEAALRRSSDRWIRSHGEPSDASSRSRLAMHLQGRGFPDALIRREVLDRHGAD